VALLAGSQGPGAEVAVVVGSGFGVVTVLLARVILREAMTRAQWAGIAAIVIGVAVLSGVR
ncbi:MAG: EamA family transporter, partial [Proteobacteria bacterium]|nr:EamA family transporter [Pseudomonadota bacterium]